MNKINLFGDLYPASGAIVLFASYRSAIYACMYVLLRNIFS